jgi:hypothetical protein
MAYPLCAGITCLSLACNAVHVAGNAFVSAATITLLPPPLLLLLLLQATPLYLSEMAPYNLRGALNILFQLAVTIGIFVAQLINYGTQVRLLVTWHCRSLYNLYQ